MSTGEIDRTRERDQPQRNTDEHLLIRDEDFSGVRSNSTVLRAAVILAFMCGIFFSSLVLACVAAFVWGASDARLLQLALGAGAFGILVQLLERFAVKTPAKFAGTRDGFSDVTRNEFSNESAAGGDEEIRQLFQSGRKIEAIKLYRTRHGSGLKEAKEAVERLGK